MDWLWKNDETHETLIDSRRTQQDKKAWEHNLARVTRRHALKNQYQVDQSGRYHVNPRMGPTVKETVQRQRTCGKRSHFSNQIQSIYPLLGFAFFFNYTEHNGQGFSLIRFLQFDCTMIF